MNILHYAGIGTNPSSGIRVIVPQMLSAQAGYATVGFYNYAQSSLELDSRIADYSRFGHPDYRRFPRPFDRPDLVVFHSPFGIPSCCTIARQLDRQGIPYVVVPHGSFTRAALGIHRLKKALALRTWMRQLVKKAAAVQFLSDGEMGASTYNAKGIVIPNGIALHAYEHREVSQVKKFLFIGRKDPVHKGIDVLVEACAKIKRELEKRGIQLSLYGPDDKGGTAAVEEMIVKYDLKEIVRNLDGVYGEEKDAAFREHDVFVLTSRFEGQPVSLTEAFSYGLPVLVTPGTNFADIVDENRCGWTAAFDAREIADRMLYIADHPQEIGECSFNAWNFAKEHYNWDVAAKKAIAQYRKLLPNELLHSKDGTDDKR